MTEAESQALLGVLPEAMMLAALDGRIIAANDAAASLLDGGNHRIAGTSIAALTTEPPEKVAGTLALFSRSGQFIPAALTFKREAGAIRCRVEGALVQLSDGPLLLLRLLPREQAMNRFRSLNERIERLNREVFERKQAAETSDRLRAIVDSCDDAIVSKDLNGIIKSWNKGAERVFGYTAAEAIGKPITLIIPPDLLEEEPVILERLKRGERVDHFETIRVRKDGSRVNISLSVSPVRDDAGRITGASKIARDVSERVRHEAFLQAANAALRCANEDLQQFAYSASHDLQEPLRMVAAYSELLQKRFGGQLGPTGDEYIRYTVQGAVRMEALLRDLRAYAQASIIDQQAVTTVDASEILQKTLLTLEDSIASSDAAVQAGPLPAVRMHDFQLEQIFQNLIANAIRYRGAAAPSIQISAEPRGDQWLFSVQDNGIGIDPQFKEQIFGIFKRLHNNAAYPGTGMGLAICQRIVERAGGRIWIESESGKGSTFFFTVPGGGAGHSNPTAAPVLHSSGRG